MRHLLSFFIALTVVSLSAQPVIDGSSSPQAGDMLIEISYDNPINIVLGPEGANQTWNFNEVGGGSESEILDFVLPSELPAVFDGMFPDAEVAFYTAEDTTAQFFVQTSDGFYTDGLGSGSENLPPPYNELDFDPNDLLFAFNFGYTDVRNHEAALTIDLDVGIPYRERSRIYSEHTADGYGTVITPAGTFNDVLRVKIARYTVDSTFADTDTDGEYELIAASGPSETTYSYFYLQNQAPIIIALLDMNEDQSAIESFSYFQDGATGITEHGIKDGIHVYPNPNQGRFFIASKETGKVSVKIYDLNGHLMYQENQVAGDSARPIDIQQLNSGTYVIEIESKGRKSSTQLVID